MCAAFVSSVGVEVSGTSSMVSRGFGGTFGSTCVKKGLQLQSARLSGRSLFVRPVWKGLGLTMVDGAGLGDNEDSSMTMVQEQDTEYAPAGGLESDGDVGMDQGDDMDGPGQEENYRRDPTPSQPEDAKLFVGNLSWNTTDMSLGAAFESFGTVIDARVITDRFTGKSRGFGFIEFDNGGSAQKALIDMNGVEIDGRAVRVDRANKKSPQNRGGYGGSSGGGGGYGGGGGGYGGGGGGGGYGGQQRRY